MGKYLVMSLYLKLSDQWDSMDDKLSHEAESLADKLDKVFVTLDEDTKELIKRS